MYIPSIIIYILQYLILFNTVNNGLVFYLGQNYHKGKEHFIHIYRVFELDITVFGYYVFTVIGVLTLPFMNLYTKNMTDYNYIDKLLPVLFCFGFQIAE